MRFYSEHATGFEPATPGLGSQCSTTEPRVLISEQTYYSIPYSKSQDIFHSCIYTIWIYLHIINTKMNKGGVKCQRIPP